MTIASFHQQVYLAGSDPLRDKLEALPSAETLRRLLTEPDDHPFWGWIRWI